jgi:hypothetical protein
VISSVQNNDSGAASSPFSPDSGDIPKTPGSKGPDMTASEREQYELELAIAMSLSDAQQKSTKNFLDIDAYTPLSVPPTRTPENETETEHELTRSSK